MLMIFANTTGLTLEPPRAGSTLLQAKGAEAPYGYNCVQKQKSPMSCVRSKLGTTWVQDLIVQYTHLPKHVCGLLLWYYKHYLLIKKINNRHLVCLKCETLSLASETEDSPGPAPAPDPELLPSDLSSDWPTGREGGMVNMKIQGMEDGGRRGSNSENHT